MHDVLEIHNDSGLINQVALDRRSMVIGRSSTADIRIKDPTVSRQHAVLTRNATGWSIKDMNSRSGTLVNGQSVIEQPLGPDDQVQLSGFTLRLQHHAPAGQPTPDSSTMWTHEPTSPDISTLTHGVPPKIGLSHIAALNSFGETLQLEPDRYARLSALCKVAAGEVLDGQWAFALSLNKKNPGRPPKILACWPQYLLRDRDVHISRTTISAMLDTETPVLASNFGKTDDLVEMSIVEGAPQTAVAACPLDSDDQETRLLYVSLLPQIATTEWLAIISLAGKEYQQAEAAWREKAALKQQAAITRDLDNARSIQTSILPEQAEFQGLDIAWSFEPCDAVGGDFIDLLTLPDGRALVAIADVSGHGLASALTTLSIHSVLQTCIKSGMDTPKMMAMLNEHLCAYLPLGRFVTMLVVLIDPATGQTQCISAGHHPPIVVSPSGDTRDLNHSAEMVLGVDTIDMAAQTDRLMPGDKMLLYTDGLIEMPQPNGGMLQTQGLTQLFANLCAETPDAATLTQALRSRLNTLQGDQPILDDQTFVIVDHTGA